jgi:hypothetical protein
MAEANHEKAIHAAFREAEREDAFWKKNYKRLLQEYPDQFIAVWAGDVIAVSPALEGMLQQLEELGIDPTKTWSRFLDAHPLPMIL